MKQNDESQLFQLQKQFDQCSSKRNSTFKLLGGRSSLTFFEENERKKENKKPKTNKITLQESFLNQMREVGDDVMKLART
jgi:hypothetical protein